MPGWPPGAWHAEPDTWQYIPCAEARLEQVGDAREQLRVDGQAAVERVARARDQAHGELVLEHDDGRAEGRAVRQQLEGERRGDLVGDVGHAQVEVGQLLPS